MSVAGLPAWEHAGIRSTYLEILMDQSYRLETTRNGTLPRGSEALSKAEKLFPLGSPAAAPCLSK